MTKKALVFSLARWESPTGFYCNFPVFFLLFGVDGVDSGGEPFSGPAFSRKHRGVDGVDSVDGGDRPGRSRRPKPLPWSPLMPPLPPTPAKRFSDLPDPPGVEVVVSFARDFKGVEDRGNFHRQINHRLLPDVEEFFGLVSPWIDFSEVLIPLCDQGTLGFITAIPFDA